MHEAISRRDCQFLPMTGIAIYGIPGSLAESIQGCRGWLACGDRWLSLQPAARMLFNFGRRESSAIDRSVLRISPRHPSRMTELPRIRVPVISADMLVWSHESLTAAPSR